MFTKRSIHKLLGVAASALLLAGSGNVLAATTAPSVNVQNSATVTYKIGTVTQDPETSNTESFLVDTKIDINVTKQADDLTNSPNEAGQYLRFEVTNNGNVAIDVLLTYEEVTALTAVAIWEETGGGATTWDNVNDTANTTLQNVTVGETRTVYIVGTLPGDAANGSNYDVHLIAQAVKESDSSVYTKDSDGDSPTVMEIVFADGTGTHTGDTNYNAYHSASGRYTVQAAILSASKTHAVTAGGAGDTYHIPGATIEYTITVSNGAGASTAETIIVEDVIPANMTYVTGSIKVTPPGGAEQSYDDTEGNDQYTNNVDAGFNVAGDKVVVQGTGINLSASQSLVVKFSATID